MPYFDRQVRRSADRVRRTRERKRGKFMAKSNAEAMLTRAFSALKAKREAKAAERAARKAAERRAA